MSDEQEPKNEQASITEQKPVSEQAPVNSTNEPVKPDNITQLFDDTAIKELTKSVNELKQVQKAIYEQQTIKTQREEKQNGKKIYY